MYVSIFSTAACTGVPKVPRERPWHTTPARAAVYLVWFTYGFNTYVPPMSYV